MNFLAFFGALILRAFTKTTPHNENLRAGQFTEPATFSPWLLLVS